VLAVHHSLGIGSLGEFVARTKASRNDLCNLGVGIHQHVVGEWFQKLAGIKLTLYVPWRWQAINDLIAAM